MSTLRQNRISGEMEFHVECVRDSKSAALSWRCCDLKQFCAKVAELNDMQEEGVLRNARNDTDYDERRDAGDAAASAFREVWNGLAPDLATSSHESVVGNAFYHRCAQARAAANGMQVGPEMQADHVHEIQLGGAPQDFGNLRWLSQSVNGSIGSTLKQFDPATAGGGISTDCCPAEGRATCADEGSDEAMAF